MKVITSIFVSLAIATIAESRAALPVAGEPELAPDRAPAPEPRWMVIADKENHLHYLDLTQRIVRLDVEESEVTFHYRSRQSESREFSLANVDEIKTTDFDPKRRTMFIIHGWNNDKNSHINTLISKALLEAEDWNVFVVDWQKKANSSYPTAMGAINGVGEIIAKFITSLVDITGLTLELVNLSGHSLGAHVAGHTGATFQGQIPVIIGMDPAMPFISYDKPEDRLDPTDAKYVQVIHTNGGLLAFLRPLGHADFYPNGGMVQNGCGIDILGTCAHGRSYKYYAESITSNNFVAVQCDTLNDWRDGKCDNNPKAKMGGNIVDSGNSGTYYLKTNSKEPFALG